MRILLTGATGYVGKRLMPVLLESGHTLVCAVRDVHRFRISPELQNKIQVVEI